MSFARSSGAGALAIGAGLVAGGLGACAREAPATATDVSVAPAASGTAPAAQAEPPAGWCAFGRGRVSFHAPCEWVDEAPQGIDSVVGAWHGETLRVDFDFGWYSDDSFGGRFDGRSMRGGTLETTTVGGRAARLASWDADGSDAPFAHVLALYVPDVDATGAEPGENKLSFTVAYRDARDAELARRILASVSIGPRTH